MKIYYGYEDFYSKENISLKNCLTIDNNNQKYYYEFIREGGEALVKYNDDKFLHDAIEFYHNENNDIYFYYNIDKSYTERFDKPYYYKLPINIIRPLKYYIELEEFNKLDKYYEKLDLKLPVVIIDDEYFLVDGHKRLLLLKEDQRMVDVYLKDIPLDQELLDLVYILREYNYKTIDDVKVYTNEEINEIFNQK